MAKLGLLALDAPWPAGQRPFSRDAFILQDEA